MATNVILDLSMYLLIGDVVEIHDVQLFAKASHIQDLDPRKTSACSSYLSISF